MLIVGGRADLRAVIVGASEDFSSNLGIVGILSTHEVLPRPNHATWKCIKLESRPVTAWVSVPCAWRGGQNHRPR